MQRSLGLLLCLAGFVLLADAGFAEVKLPALFGNHMVLQREMPVPVWGWADPGEKVTVTFRDQKKTAQADAQGNWSVRLDPLTLGKPGTLTVSGSNQLVLEDVLVGEVWICSGQSNMKWTVANALDADMEIAAANYPRIRLFNVPQVPAAEPQKDVQCEWTRCSSKTIPSFSAVAYYYGRTLHQTLDVPIGLIETAWGGTRAEAWTSPEAMARTKALQPIVDTWTEREKNYDPQRAQEQYEQALKVWKEKAAQAKKAGRRIPRRPQKTPDPHVNRHRYSTLYNGMVAPLVPFAIRGAIWYQGESNASRAYQYRTLMPTMIQSWRDAWKQGDFPFYMVQLANFRAIKPEPEESDWAELREAQMLTTDALPNVGVACITDLGAALDIHPKDKQNVGKRLARLALVDNYGFADQLVRQGPVYRSLDIQGNKCVVHFDVGSSPLTTYYRQPLKGFAIAGADRKWHWAQAKITGTDTVEVFHPDVPEPVAVRYNWADNPQGTLYNKQYLPAYPFRTDDWKGVTAERVTP